MNVYAYQADIYCENCANKIRYELSREGKEPNNISDETSYDTDEYPKGPYPDGGGEADSPQHCGGCNTFLENPLTQYGYEYTKEHIERDIRNSYYGSVAIQEWGQFYGIDIEEIANHILFGMSGTESLDQDS